MILIEKNGDLFSSTDSKAHCISADCRLGAGIALHFRRRYGQINNIKTQRKKVGQVAYFEHTPGEYIFNLVPKQRFWEKPTYADLYQCLKDLTLICEQLGVRRLALPKIGCGLDNLEFTRVRKLIVQAFNTKDIVITIFKQ